MSYLVLDVMAEYTDRTTGNRQIRAQLIADTAADLPANTTALTWLLGSYAKAVDTGKEYYIDSGGTWIEQPSNNAFDNVYTISEIDTMLTDYYTTTQIDTMLTDYYTTTQIDEKLTHKAAVSFTPTPIVSLLNCTFTIPDSTRTLRFTVGKLNATQNYLQIYVNGVDKGYIIFDVSRNIDNWGE